MLLTLSTPTHRQPYPIASNQVLVHISCLNKNEVPKTPTNPKNINTNKGHFIADEKQLLHDYISPEELWACTSCNACVEACPIAIDPLSIIMDMRQYLTLEESAAPAALNAMMSNIENNGAPWPFSNQDRLQWANDV